jgi:raffinose/stachyose/melibiose transport system substrate-binding protein
MKTRRFLVAFAALAVLAAACGTGEDPREGVDAAGGEDSTAAASEGEGAGEGEGEAVTLVIESWRNDDLTIWEDTIIPAFEEQHPNISVEFQPTAPDEYDAALETKLNGGTAGDLITCRPFDVSLGLFEDGQLEAVTDLPGLENFGDIARSGWVTDDGSEVYCVPMASVIHGFMYNADAFNELGLSEPATEAEFFELLQTIADDGTYEPLAMGTADQWEAATMGFQNIGPNYWEGEAGRQRLIEGEDKFTDPEYVEVFNQLAEWAPFMPDGYESVTYADAQNLFTLGRAAIYPTGSWEIALFRDQAEFEMGAFKPPVPEGTDGCYISDHVDIGIGMNAAGENPEEARTFLEWVTTAEFAELYSNALPGFFTLSDHEVTLEDPLAQTFVDWRSECETTIRNSYQVLSRGEPNLENELWDTSAQVINESMTPQEAAEQLQSGLDRWYEPAQ